MILTHDHILKGIIMGIEEKEKYIYESILNDMTDGVIVIGFDGKISICNQAAESALDISEGGLVGKSVAELMNGFEENDEFFELILDAVYKRKKVTKTVPFRTNGIMKYLRVTTSFLLKGEDPVALIAVISDNTEPVELFICNKRLANQVINLMNSFVEVMVTETEERSAYNADHTKNMVRYANTYLEWLREQGTLENYTSEDTAPFIMSIWLHDIGKLMVPPEIMDKPSRLADKLGGVLHRIETTKLMLRIQTLSGDITSDECSERTEQLDLAKELIVTANTAILLDEDTIAGRNGIAGTVCITAEGSEIPLLDEKELEAITTAKGTLTADEREIIKTHVTFTKELLSKMEFRGIYRNVPKWAAGHHEFLDGTGYPDCLTAEDIPWETRLLTIIDIYEALVARDRPYKKPVPIDWAFAILRNMAKGGKLDSEILESFYESGAWKNDDERT